MVFLFVHLFFLMFRWKESVVSKLCKRKKINCKPIIFFMLIINTKTNQNVRLCRFILHSSKFSFIFTVCILCLFIKLNTNKMCFILCQVLILEIFELEKLCNLPPDGLLRLNMLDIDLLILIRFESLRLKGSYDDDGVTCTGDVEEMLAYVVC